MFGPLKCINDFASATKRLPLPVGSEPRPNNAAPSVQPHYRAFIPTTSRSAPHAPHRYSGPCGFSRLDVSLGIGTTGSHVPYKSLLQLRAPYMPDAARAAFRQPPNRSRDIGQTLVLTSPNPLSTRHRRFAPARLSHPYLPGSCPDFPAKLTTIALNDSSLQWFEACT